MDQRRAARQQHDEDDDGQRQHRADAAADGHRDVPAVGVGVHALPQLAGRVVAVHDHAHLVVGVGHQVLDGVGALGGLQQAAVLHVAAGHLLVVHLERVHERPHKVLHLPRHVYRRRGRRVDFWLEAIDEVCGTLGHRHAGYVAGNIHVRLC